MCGLTVDGDVHDDRTQEPSVHSFDPETHEWRRERSLRRGGATGAVVYDGKMYAFSGSFTGSVGAQLYDPETETWTLMADRPLDEAGRFVIGAEFIGDRIIVVSQCASGGPRLFHYDPLADSWTRM